MDLRRLRTFVAVAEHGAVSRAAEVLHITQPALSRQIAGLEDHLGFKLFQRAGRRLVPTVRAEEFLADARGLLEHASALDERAQNLRRGSMRELKVTGSALTVGALFPSFIGHYAEAVPDVRLSLIEAHMAGHLGMLERGEAHVAITVLNVIDFDELRFAARLLPQFQLQAACAHTFPLERAESIDIKGLAPHPLLVLDTSYATRGVFDAACRLARLRPNIAVESSSAHVLAALAEVGHGVAIIPSILKVDPWKLRVMRVTHRRAPLHLALAVMWDRRRTLPRYAEEFADLMDQHIRMMFFDGGPGPRRRR